MDESHTLGEVEDHWRKTILKVKVYDRSFGFSTKDTIEGVSAFRIDSRTIKRGILIEIAVIMCH